LVLLLIHLPCPDLAVLSVAAIADPENIPSKPWGADPSHQPIHTLAMLLTSGRAQPHFEILR